MLRVIGRSWCKLDGIAFNNKTLDIVGCGDIHPFHPGPQFPSVEKLFVRDCDKNFVYYWLNKSHFPNVKTIYLDCHPCEYPVAHRFKDSAQLFMDEFYYKYYGGGRWWTKDNQYITPISTKDILKEVQKEEKNGVVDIINFFKEAKESKISVLGQKQRNILNCK